MYQFETLTLAQLRALAKKSVGHYREQLASAPFDSSIVVSDTKAYLAIWIDASEACDVADQADEARENMTPEQRAEFEDAIDCGDFDELLRGPST